MASQPDIVSKRIYEPVSPEDGQRVLIDRLWPRGVSKAEAHVDLWFKDIAPSTELRQWFAHDPARWEEVRRRYRAELQANPDAVARLRQLAGKGRVTLLYAARDAAHNHALILLEFLDQPPEDTLPTG
ncbi:uroporphyrin-III methyltransferase [Devosia limi DSM 17137]|uniref:Uroporphyrin-III methyltransferase n=1 Tax=Devosia limi DSM 17137 TaxID=1121477 RepID=A0A0F5LUJ5_9HYPH|nr:DUF488 domain-containing protein [Devosia limi]KKB85834.1 uroporphyrin-III methyltransferase [Devosia limi DSM 17137]SHE34885.1 Uncharacterized conserved protein YeaO, DUF488 family [Devosia limi DSM 17137]